jgi:glycosyltransferase involved in cell wall biosynthesis
MATGTPVIAWACGSVPEVVAHEVSGFIVDSIEDAVLAVKMSGKLRRAAVRADFEARFTATRMARAYLGAYRRLLARGSRTPQLVAAE